MHWMPVQCLWHPLAMSKYRDYTGLLRTPPSLAWLIRERSRLKGQIDQCEKALDQLPRTLVELNQQLAALDAVIPRHEVKVDPKRIVGTRPRGPALLPFGVMSREILRCLRQAEGTPRYTSEIAMHVARATGLDMTKVRKADLIGRVGDRLKKMRAAGLIRSQHDQATNSEGTWALVQDAEEEQSPPAMKRKAG